MPVTMHNLENEQPFEQLLMALVGREKSGKSRLAATAPKPILFLDFDNRAASIAGRKGCFAASFVDNVGVKQPDAFSEAMELLTKLETAKGDLAYCGFPGLQPGDAIVQTIVIDSLQSMATDAMRYFKFTGGKAMARVLNVGGMQIAFPAGFDAWNAEMSAIEDSVLRVFGLRNAHNKLVNVIVTFHETAEEDPTSTSENPIYTGKVGIFPVRYQRLLRYFNEVWRVERTQSLDGKAQGAVPRVSTAPDYAFALGASTLNIDAVEYPDIEELIEKHKKAGPYTPPPRGAVSQPRSSANSTSQKTSPNISSIPGIVSTSATPAVAESTAVVKKDEKS